MCDDHLPTVILVKSKDGKRIVGGYTDRIWNSNENTYGYRVSKHTFIFDLNQKKQYKINGYYSIACTSSSLPIFGESQELMINVNNNVTFNPRNPKGGKPASKASIITLGELEVFEVRHFEADEYITGYTGSEEANAENDDSEADNYELENSEEEDEDSNESEEEEKPKEPSKAADKTKKKLKLKPEELSDEEMKDENDEEKEDDDEDFEDLEDDEEDECVSSGEGKKEKPKKISPGQVI
jgi:hypothetical protein